MKINKKALLKVLEHNCSTRSHGCDYLQISVTKTMGFECYFNLLDNDNSPYAIMEGVFHTYTFAIDYSQKHKTILISLSDDDKSYPLIKIKSFGKKQNFTNIRYSVYILGTAFRFIEMGKFTSLHTLLEDIFGYDYEILSSSCLTRVDYKVDMFYKDPKHIPSQRKLINYRRGTKNSTFKIVQEDMAKHASLVRAIQEGKQISYTQESYTSSRTGTVNAWTIGKNNTKTVKVRCYEKLIDSIAKGKFGLYSDYFDYSNVYRLEAEFRSNFCKKPGGNSYTLAEFAYLLHKAQGFFGLVDVESTYFYHSRTLSTCIHGNIQKYIKGYTNKGLKLYHNNINPFQVQSESLLEAGFDSSKVKLLLNKIDLR